MKFGAIIFVILLLPCYAFSAEQKPPLQFGKDVRIQQVKPQKPVKIRLHRTAKGDYSWDLTGDNVDDIIRTDSRLRKMLKVE